MVATVWGGGWWRRTARALGRIDGGGDAGRLGESWR